VPVMTRLRMADRRVLDTLIDAGVARSRSEALAWCVRLVSQHEADWIRELRDAMSAVEEVRSRGPSSAESS
jgi:Arc/MetJ-type ribon-helix-helix transcriptional regulator